MPSATQSPLLSLQDVHTHTGISYPSIRIYKNTTTLIQGESGAGKSTLFELCNGMHTPKGGTILYKDKDIAAWDILALRREILVVTQKPFLFSQSIQENFESFYEYREEICISSEKMQNYLELCQLALPLDTPCDILSGGEKQRLFIAICLSFVPQMALLDEPTAALDNKTASALMHNIKDFAKKHAMTLVIITHDASLHTGVDQVITLKKHSSTHSASA